MTRIYLGKAMLERVAASRIAAEGMLGSRYADDVRDLVRCALRDGEEWLGFELRDGVVVACRDNCPFKKYRSPLTSLPSERPERRGKPPAGTRNDF
ncbi:hypothetical protein [Paraburkholderia nodosa]|uniref:hypothetical protein n=1 Tax=Paraburkholderia nodosa TaxID=392320 RepID=UPI0004850BE5|nr:hypothetical protein [Paraburkholderia nodosa]